MPFLPITNVAAMKKATDEPKFATVISNNDPEKLGRIKVRLDGLFEGSEETLPWIRRKMDTLFCGNNVEIFDVPEVGSIVEIRWSYDENTPVYSGAPYNQRHKSGTFTDNYPHEGGFKFGNNIIKFDKASDMITIENGQTQIVLDGLGTVSIAGDDINILADSDVTITAKNTIIQGNLTVDGDLTASKAASGVLSPQSMAVVANGIVSAIK